MGADGRVGPVRFGNGWCTRGMRVHRRLVPGLWRINPLITGIWFCMWFVVLIRSVTRISGRSHALALGFRR